MKNVATFAMFILCVGISKQSLTLNNVLERPGLHIFTDAQHEHPALEDNYAMEKEIWKPIPGYENRYEVSTHGRIRSVTDPIPQVIRTYNAGGYRAVALRGADGVKKTFRVHRLVAFAFIENPHNKPHINHKDLCKHNNHLSNLEWCTPQENATHAQISMGDLSLEDVYEIYRLRDTMTRKELAKKFKVAYCRLQAIVTGYTFPDLYERYFGEKPITRLRDDMNKHTSEKINKIHQLRAEGKTFREITGIMGYSHMSTLHAFFHRHVNGVNYKRKGSRVKKNAESLINNK